MHKKLIYERQLSIMDIGEAVLCMMIIALAFMLLVTERHSTGKNSSSIQFRKIQF